MNAQRPLSGSFDPASPKEVHSCRECERHVAIAERELASLVMAVQNLFGDAEANRVAKDWIGLAEDQNVSLTDPGWPRWLTVAIIGQLAERQCQMPNQQRQGD